MYKRFLKRVIDIVLSALALVLLAIPMLVIALVIKIDDPGPALFTQKRVSRGKSLFRLHKFRSMKMSTPHDMPTHLLENPEQYITKIGRFLRKSSLDELPQIWDIFCGHMSIIGPRPALWNQEDLLAERDKYGANDVRPGLTGWAQINGRDELEIAEKARLDGDYVRTLRAGGFHAFGFDCRCFFGTFLKVLRSEGIVEGGTGAVQGHKTVAVLSSHTPSIFWFRMEMMEEFQARGWTVWAVGNEPEADWAERFQEHGIGYRQINVQRNGVNPLHDLKTLSSIKRVSRELHPDKLFTFQAKTNIYGAMAANSLGITEVYPLVAGVGSVFLSSSAKARLVRFVLTREYRYALRKCPAAFFQNEDDEVLFRRYRIITKQKTVRLRGSGVNLDKFQVSPLPEHPAFLCISRLIRDKGVMEYLEACQMLKEADPEVRCMLVGPYDSNPSSISPEELQPYIDSGVIEYFGEQSDVRPYLAQASVFVLPSYREGTPKTVLEAMACGRAVITTDAPGCRETVRDGENGYLVSVRDAEAVFRRMQKLASAPGLAAEMGSRGRTMAEEVFDVRRVNKEICRTMGI